MRISLLILPVSYVYCSSRLWPWTPPRPRRVCPIHHHQLQGRDKLPEHQDAETIRRRLRSCRQAALPPASGFPWAWR